MATRILLESQPDGAFGALSWTARTEDGKTRRVEGKAASLIFLLLGDGDYKLRGDINVLDLFDSDSLIPGQRAFVEKYAAEHPDEAARVWDDWYKLHPGTSPREESSQ